MTDILARFLIGGVVVSLFAVLGDLFRPKTFAGLFGAAPSIALATLGLTIHQHGTAYAAIEGRSMLLGAVALGLYSAGVAVTLLRYRSGVLKTATFGILIWVGGAFGLCWGLLP